MGAVECKLQMFQTQIQQVVGAVDVVHFYSQVHQLINKIGVYQPGEVVAKNTVCGCGSHP